ncbi:MAG: AI-2E family transporter [Burkholderiales bacterium]|nr:AI-2E family transporter [Burkholderiales bacterium]
MIQTRIERYVWPAALAALAVACVLVLRPFFSAILWAAILTFTTWPLYLRLRSRVGDRMTLAASLMTTAIVLALLVPIALAALGLADNAEVLVQTVKGWLDRGLPQPPAWVASLPVIGASVQERWAAMATDRLAFTQALQPFMGNTRSWLLAVGQTLLEGTLTLLLSTFICFFLYRDGDAIASRGRRLVTRLAGASAWRLIDVAEGTIRGVVYGIIGTAFAQALLQAIGLLIAGVPGALMLGGLTFFLSVVPFGPPLVWLGATAWLWFEGSVGWAIFTLLWGALLVSTVDNVIKPYLISRGAKLPFILVLLGVLGGVLAFGFIGVFIGPTLLAVAYRLVLEWSAMQREGLNEEAAESGP